VLSGGGARGGAHVGVLRVLEELNVEVDYEQAAGSGSFVLSWGKNTANLSYEGGYSFDDAAPLERWYQLGGLGNPFRPNYFD
jgi:hypothetical protein